MAARLAGLFRIASPPPPTSTAEYSGLFCVIKPFCVCGWRSSRSPRRCNCPVLRLPRRPARPRPAPGASSRNRPPFLALWLKLVARLAGRRPGLGFFMTPRFLRTSTPKTKRLRPQSWPPPRPEASSSRLEAFFSARQLECSALRGRCRASQSWAEAATDRACGSRSITLPRPPAVRSGANSTAAV